jgi:hypothetical protein
MCVQATPSAARRSIWDRIFGTGPAAAEPGPPDNVILLPDVEDLDAMREWLRDQVTAGKATCRKCRAVIGDEPGESCGLLHRRWCYSCDATWIETTVLHPLADRVGPRTARRALRRLVTTIEALT